MRGPGGAVRRAHLGITLHLRRAVAVGRALRIHLRVRIGDAVALRRAHRRRICRPHLRDAPALSRSARSCRCPVIRRALCLLAGAFCALGCTTTTSMRVNFLESHVDAAHPATYFGMPLRSGQIVITEAPGSYSFMFLLIPAKFYPFTHAAVVSVENGEPFVYDISGEYKLGFNDRVMDGVEGGMRRQPFLQYVSANLYAEVIDPPASIDGEKVAAFARAQVAKNTRFDAYFRFDEHEKLYCTELVQLALEAGGDKPRALAEVNDNASIRAGMKWLGVPPDSAAIPAAMFQDESRMVAALGRFRTRASAYAYFEAKHELYRRFQKDQRLGFLFDLQWTGDIVVHPEIEAFAYDAAALFAESKVPVSAHDPCIAAAVHKMAGERFGPSGLAP